MNSRTRNCMVAAVSAGLVATIAAVTGFSFVTLVLGAAFGVVAGLVQVACLREANLPPVAIESAVEFRRAVRSCPSGSRAVLLERVLIGVLAVTALFTGPLASMTAGVGAFLCARELTTLRLPGVPTLMKSRQPE